VYSVENASPVVGGVPEQQLDSFIGEQFAKELSGGETVKCQSNAPRLLKDCCVSGVVLCVGNLEGWRFVLLGRGDETVRRNTRDRGDESEKLSRVKIVCGLRDLFGRRNH
jgi:hypothetical protein